MTTYQGPHASVTQQFITSPGAVAIENLPPALVGTAYNVFKKQNIGSHYGIIDQELSWGYDDVVYSRDVVGRRGYDYYPPTVYASSVFGDIDLELTSSDLSADGATISIDDVFSVPNIAKAAGESEAIIPFYKKDSEIISSASTTTSTTASKLVDSAADFVTDGVAVGDRIDNTTDNTSALVTAVDSLTTLSIDTDIMTSGEGYYITRPVKILSDDLRTVIVPGGAVVTAQVKPGQAVYCRTPGASITWTYMGVVGSVGSDETKITLASAYSAAFTGTSIIVGCINTGANILAADDEYALINMPTTFYDASADFIGNKVKVGDLINFSSLSLSGSVATPIVASITSIINKTTLRFNTMALAAGSVDSDFLKYKASTEAPGSTINVYSYDITRLVGFSQNYGLKNLGAAGLMVDTATASSVVIPNVEVSDDVPAMKANDIVMFTTATVASGTNERDVFPTTRALYRIKTISYDGSNYTLTFDETIYSSTDGTTPVATGHYVHAWTPKNELDIVADFRSIRSEEQGVVKRIESIEDIFTNFVNSDEEEIDPRNELAFMVNIAFQRSGGKVCYAVNVDASAGNLSTEYGEAFEELSVIDCYSHAFGTTDSSVNGSVATYCNSQAEPYEGHERIGIVCYDQNDVYLQGTDSGSNTSAGLITISGSFNPITAGVTVSDEVNIYDASGDFVETVTVTQTPSIATQIQTDGETAHAAGHTYRFLSGRKADQAIKIGALGLGERRVSIVWPGWFTADYGDETILVPPYFITAAIAGMDCGIIASQSFTNYDFSIPGLSNIQLDTNTYFRKLQLDEIGGGGVNVMIQSASISQTIKSRHDLTSNMDSVEFRERSITKQADVAAKTLRNGVAPYIGKYNITDALFRFLNQVCSIIATKLVKDTIIKKLTINSIERDEVITDKINFYITATVFVAGNYFDITLTVVSR